MNPRTSVACARAAARGPAARAAARAAAALAAVAALTAAGCSGARTRTEAAPSPPASRSGSEATSPPQAENPSAARPHESGLTPPSDPVVAAAIDAAVRAHEVLTTPATLSPGDSRVLAAAALDELADALGAPRAAGSWPGVPAEDRVLFRARAADVFARARHAVPADLALRLVRAMARTTGDPNTFAVDPTGLVALLGQVGGQPVVAAGLRAHVTADARWVVSEVIPGSAAAAAGVARGDRLVSIDGRPIDRAALAALTGAPAGTTAIVRLAHPGAPPADVALHLAALSPPVVDHRILPGRVGLVRIHTLTQSEDPARDAAHQIDRALAALARRRVQRLIIDLRDEAGGAPFAAAARLVPSSPVAVIQDEGGDVQPVPRTGPPPRHFARIAVLVNGQTEGAAEVVALALKAQGVARVFGQPTAGALSVPRPIPLPGSVTLFAPHALVLDPVSKKPPPDRRVSPDQAVPTATQADYARGRDPALDAARAWSTGQP